MVEIIKNLPFEDYRARKGINASILKTVHSYSLLHAKAEMDGLRSIETQTLDFGKCFHSLTLENIVDWSVKPLTYPAPEDHADVKKGKIKAGDPLKWNGNAGYCKEWESKQGSKVILSADEDRRVNGMRDVLHSDPEIKALIGGDNELSVFVESDGFVRKCRIDGLPVGDDAPVIDLKSGDCVHPEIFMSNAMKYGWDIQAAWNLDVLKLAGKPRKEFWFVAVESDYPHAHTILKFKDTPGSFLRLGRIKYRAAFQRIKNAIRDNKWPSYDSGEAELFAKDWQLKQLEQTL